MKCIYKNEEKVRCCWQSEEDRIFCYVHEPLSFPIFFTQDHGKYKKSDIKTSLPIRTAKHYVKIGVAIHIDENVRKQISEALVKSIDIYNTKVIETIKKAISENDVVELVSFFGNPSKERMSKIRKFIGQNEFTENERSYLKIFIEELKKVLNK